MTAQNLAKEQVFPKNIDWRKTEQCVQRQDEIVADHYSHLEKTFLQLADIENVKREETFTTFSNGLDEPSALVERNLLNWATVDTHDLVNLASQLSRTTEKNNKRKMNQALNY